MDGLPVPSSGKYPGVLKTLFARTRSIFQIAKENPDEKYYFIMENHFPKIFEIGIFWLFVVSHRVYNSVLEIFLITRYKENPQNAVVNPM